MDATVQLDRREDAPRERLLRLGPQALADRELVAVLLRTGTTGEGVMALADRLLDRGLVGLSQTSPRELTAVRGVGAAKATSLAAAFELGRRAAGRLEERPSFARPETVFAYARWRFPADTEELRVFFLDQRLGLIAEDVVAKGGPDWTGAPVKDVLGRALRISARAVVLAHNHPGGDPAPSPADLAATSAIRSAGEVVGVELLDHVIIGAKTFFSFRRASFLGPVGKEPMRP